MVLPKLVAIFELVQVILVLDKGKNKKSVHDITIKKAFHMRANSLSLSKHFV